MELIRVDIVAHVYETTAAFIVPSGKVLPESHLGTLLRRTEFDGLQLRLVMALLHKVLLLALHGLDWEEGRMLGQRPLDLSI